MIDDPLTATAGGPIAAVAAALASAVADTKAALAKLGVEIDALDQERARIAQAAPHADDIVQVFLRGLDAAKRSLLTRMSSHLSARNWSGERGAAYVQSGGTAQLLTIGTRDNADVLAPGVIGPNETAALDASALAYFLRDQIAAEIPALVDRLIPEAQRGMRQADRDTALADLDARLVDLRAARERMQLDMASLKAAAR